LSVCFLYPVIKTNEQLSLVPFDISSFNILFVFITGYMNISYEDNLEDEYMITKYTIFHILYGSLFAIYSTSYTCLMVSIILHVIFEVFENTEYGIWIFRRNTIWKNYSGDSLSNSLSDIIAGLFGFMIIAGLLQIIRNFSIFRH
jgi:hypothetical protein